MKKILSKTTCTQWRFRGQQLHNNQQVSLHMCDINVFLSKGRKHQYVDKKIHPLEGNLKIDAICHGDAAENYMSRQTFCNGKILIFLAGKMIKSLARDDFQRLQKV